MYFLISRLSLNYCLTKIKKVLLLSTEIVADYYQGLAQALMSNILILITIINFL